MKKIGYGMIGMLMAVLLILTLQSVTPPLQAYAAAGGGSENVNSALQGQFHLGHVVKIYVPSTTNESVPVTEEIHAQFVDQKARL